MSFRIIVMEDVDRSRSRDSPSLSRVTGDALDPGKHWYVVTKHLCGSRPKEFAKSEIFRHFPDEMQSVDPRDLKPATRGCDFNRQPVHLFVVSSFGLCAGLLRQRKFAEDEFLSSDKFASVVNTLNGIKLDSDSTCSFGGKSCPVNINNDAQEMECKMGVAGLHDSYLMFLMPFAPSICFERVFYI